MQLQALLLKELAAACCVDGLMEFLVVVIIGVAVAGPGRQLTAPMGSRDCRARFVIQPAGSERSSQTFELCHDLKHLENSVRRRIDDDRPAARANLDKPNRIELHQGFADGCPRYTEPGGQHHFVQPFAGRELIGKNRVFNLVSKPPANVFRHAFHLDNTKISFLYTQ